MSLFNYKVGKYIELPESHKSDWDESARYKGTLYKGFNYTWNLKLRANCLKLKKCNEALQGKDDN